MLCWCAAGSAVNNGKAWIPIDSNVRIAAQLNQWLRFSPAERVTKNRPTLGSYRRVCTALRMKNGTDAAGRQGLSQQVLEFKVRLE